jgi:hypothetical protein
MANSAAQFDTLGQTPVQLKAGSGTLYGYDIGNSDGSPAMVLFYDRATPPVYGTDTPLLRVLVPPGLNAYRTTAAAGIAFTAGLYILVKTLHGTQQLNVSGHVELL